MNFTSLRAPPWVLLPELLKRPLATGNSQLGSSHVILSPLGPLGPLGMGSHMAHVAPICTRILLPDLKSGECSLQPKNV